MIWVVKNPIFGRPPPSNKQNSATNTCQGPIQDGAYRARLGLVKCAKQAGGWRSEFVFFLRPWKGKGLLPAAFVTWGRIFLLSSGCLMLKWAVDHTFWVVSLFRRMGSNSILLLEMIERLSVSLSTIRIWTELAFNTNASRSWKRLVLLTSLSPVLSRTGKGLRVAKVS